MPSALRTLCGTLCLFALPLCAFFWGRPQPLPSADFTFVLPKENSTVDPAAATSVSDGWIVQALFEGLTRLDPATLEPVPAAADRWSITADGREYSFHIDSRGCWSDGVAVTADDFVRSWQRLLAPGTASAFAFLLLGVEHAREVMRGERPPTDLGIHAADPNTLVVRLGEATPYFLALTSHFALSPVRTDRIDAYGAAWTRPERWVSNGPYLLELRRVRDRLRLRANPRHRGAGTLALRVVDALAIEDDNTALNLYLTGAVDWINAIPSSALPWLAGRPDLRLTTILATNFVRFNCTRPPFDDVRIRRAIELAIDREALCRFVYRGAERPARSLVPPSLPLYSPPTGEPESVETALALLAAAGHPRGVGLPEIELLHSADDTERAVAEAIAARLRDQLGLTVRPAPQEFRVFLDSQRKLKYQMCLATWIGDYPDPSNFLDLFTSDSSANRTGWQDPQYDALLGAAAATSEPALRATRLAEAERLLMQRGPIAPISFRGQANLIDPDIMGFHDNLLDLHPLDALRRRP